jgi:opacity protein-like surface antigen
MPVMRVKTLMLGSAASALSLLAVSPASAGTYFSLFGGGNWANNLKPSSGGGNTVQSTLNTSVLHTAIPDTHALTFNFTATTTYAMSGAKAETGFVFGAAVGTDLTSFFPGLRVEGEFSYRHNDLKNARLAAHASDTATDTSFFSPGSRVIGNPNVVPGGLITVPTGTHTFTANFTTGFAAGPSRGDVSTWAVMANAWYDFGSGGSLVPYVGGGIGYAHSKLRVQGIANGSDGNFAWQLGAGVNYNISADAQIGIGYRYFDGGTVNIEIPTLTGLAAGRDYDVQDHAVMLSLTVRR